MWNETIMSNGLYTTVKTNTSSLNIKVTFVSIVTHLGNGVYGVPALRQDLRDGVIKKADET